LWVHHQGRSRINKHLTLVHMQHPPTNIPA
jgi:hypothetical protein